MWSNRNRICKEAAVKKSVTLFRLSNGRALAVLYSRMLASRQPGDAERCRKRPARRRARWRALLRDGDVRVEGLIYDTIKENSQPPSLKHAFARASTISTTVSHTHGFFDKISSSTGKDSEIVTGATAHTTQDSALNAQNEEHRIASPELSSARTLYAPSATLTTPALRDKRYKGELAEQLFGAVNCTSLTRNSLGRLSQSLPNLLQAFAVKISYQASLLMHCNVLFYVRRDHV
jgi:hypothetical protein